MIGNLEWSHDEEKQELENSLGRLKQTEGWEKLTDRQRKIIEMSLYTQQRAERTTDPASVLAIQSKKTYGDHVIQTKIFDEVDLFTNRGSLHPRHRKYRESQNYITDVSCLMSIATLEGTSFVRGSHFVEPNGFFDAEYKKYHDYKTLEVSIDKDGYPCVVHLKGEDNYFGKSTKMHSFLLMGHGSDGELVVWEKKAYNLAFQVVNFHEVYKRFEKEGLYYGFRALKNPDMVA